MTWYQQRRELKECVDCRKPGCQRARCFDCRWKRSAACRTQKPISRQYRRAWYDKQKARGLCVRCGLYAGGAATCLECRTAFRESQKGKTVPLEVRKRKHERVTAKTIRQRVCDAHGITVDDMTGRCRTRNFTEARRDFAHKMRDRGWSLPRIGELINCHHTSVIHLLKPQHGEQPKNGSGM